MAARGWGLDQDRNTERERQREGRDAGVWKEEERHTAGAGDIYTETDTQGETRRL